MEIVISSTANDLFGFFVKDHKGIGLAIFFFGKSLVKIVINGSRRRNGSVPKLPKDAVLGGGQKGVLMGCVKR